MSARIGGEGGALARGGRSRPGLMLSDAERPFLTVDEQRRRLPVGRDQGDAFDRFLPHRKNPRRAAVDHDHCFSGKQADHAYLGGPTGSGRQEKQGRYNTKLEHDGLISHRNPVAIFRHSRTEGPGYFATFLDAHRIPHRLVKIDAGEQVPADPREFSGLAFMGGPMSVNDDLPWIRDVLGLINSASRSDIPVLGHCLGGQLIAKALGGVVSRNRVKEIGWGTVAVADSAAARDWFGPTRE